MSYSSELMRYTGLTAYNGNLRMWDIQTNRPAKSRIIKIWDYSSIPGFEWDVDAMNALWDDPARRGEIKAPLAVLTRAIINDLTSDEFPNVLIKAADLNDQAKQYSKWMFDTLKEMEAENVVVLFNFGGGNSNKMEARFVPEDNEQPLYYDLSKKSVRDITASLNKEGKRVITLVVGRSKWGDQYANTTRFFIGLTKEAASWETLMQSLPGRGSGYGKQSVLIVSKAEKISIEDFCKNHGVDLHGNKRLSHNTYQDDDLTRRTGSDRPAIRPDADVERLGDVVPSMKAFVAKVEEVWNMYPEFRRPEGTNVIHKGKSRNSLIHDLESRFLPLISKESNIPYAVPGEEIAKNDKGDMITMGNGRDTLFPRLAYDYPNWIGVHTPAMRGSKHGGGVQYGLTWLNRTCHVCRRNTRNVMMALTLSLSTKTKAYRQEGEYHKIINDLLRLRQDLEVQHGTLKRTNGLFGICCERYARLGIFELQIYRSQNDKIVPIQSLSDAITRSVIPKPKVMERLRVVVDNEC